MGAFLDGACEGDPKLREELESLLKQPRTTTIIGTTKQDAGNGKVLSPLAQLPAELVPAEIVPAEARVARAGAGNAWRFSPGEVIAAGRYTTLVRWAAAAPARSTRRTIRSWIKKWR